jgi:hypothetical protein
VTETRLGEFGVIGVLTLLLLGLLAPLLLR